MTLLGVDTGGTFTDFVLLQDGAIRVHKVLSTPKAPEQAILQGIRELGLQEAEDLMVVHGSTVATNAVLEGKGVPTVFITNFGLRDMLTIGRQARRELYNLNPPLIPPPVPRDWCLETGGRLSARGEIIEPLTEEELKILRQQVEALSAQGAPQAPPQAVAINLLFSYLDDSFERAIEAVIPEGVFVSRSSKVLAESKEYERGITTWLNACVGPLVQNYLQRLCAGIPQAKISVMQSSGGTIGAEQAGEQAVHMLLSGPAGGLAGVKYVGELAGCQQLLSFDMGGTSTDVALLDGELRLTSEGHIGGYPVGVSMVDMHTIGAGGGSIARVDAGGLLQVGPESAGADPGPACYGQGGVEPTVTDANVVLGRLRPEAFLGGNMQLDLEAARNAVAKVAEPLGLTIEEAAQGIIQVANEHMARALRVMSVQRGIDPRGLTLACFGGAGGLHVCALAEALGMTQALVPVHGGVLSAFGMLIAPRARHLSHTLNFMLEELAQNEAKLHSVAQALESEGKAALMNEGVSEADIQTELSVDLRYQGQSYTISLPWQGSAATEQAYHQQHEKLYGHRLDLPVELVTLRCKVSSPQPAIALQANQSEKSKESLKATLFGVEEGVLIIPRESISVGETQTGPLLITEQVSTTFVAPGWKCVREESGSLLLIKAG